MYNYTIIPESMANEEQNPTITIAICARIQRYLAGSISMGISTPVDQQARVSKRERFSEWPKRGPCGILYRVDTQYGGTRSAIVDTREI